MYRCSECNKQFKEKVEYCDCGNNIFEYIEDKRLLPIEKKSNIVSWIFFLICIILSMMVWLIPVKSNLPEKIAEPKTVKVENIPDISKFWDDTPVRQEIPKENTIEQIIVYEQQEIQQNPIERKVQPKAEQKIQTLNTQPKTQTSQQKKQPTQQKLQTTQSKAQSTQPKVMQQQAPQKSPYNPNSPQMIKYKSNLRSVLFSKFAVGAIQGSGECSVQFSVDKSGKLINRKFTHESNNKSLNDTVYYMLMSVPRFSTPPEGYNGEPISMNFKINNGNYEISIY